MSESERPRPEPEGGPDQDESGPRSLNPSDGAPEAPLFLRDRSDGDKGDAQDEKDEVGE